MAIWVLTGEESKQRGEDICSLFFVFFFVYFRELIWRIWRDYFWYEKIFESNLIRTGKKNVANYNFGINIGWRNETLNLWKTRHETVPLSNRCTTGRTMPFVSTTPSVFTRDFHSHIHGWARRKKTYLGIIWLAAPYMPWWLTFCKPEKNCRGDRFSHRFTVVNNQRMGSKLKLTELCVDKAIFPRRQTIGDSLDTTDNPIRNSHRTRAYRKIAESLMLDPVCFGGFCDRVRNFFDVVEIWKLNWRAVWASWSRGAWWVVTSSNFSAWSEVTIRWTVAPAFSEERSSVVVDWWIDKGRVITDDVIIREKLRAWQIIGWKQQRINTVTLVWERIQIGLRLGQFCQKHKNTETTNQKHDGPWNRKIKRK